MSIYQIYPTTKPDGKQCPKCESFNCVHFVDGEGASVLIICLDCGKMTTLGGESEGTPPVSTTSS